ncbi:MAG: O-methyltransferase [Actinomycetota bacterium]|jgi:caffeoyl-CoA O-methyltransferase|nr:O-methyltransferase [Actinomycetota bacterium]
MPILHSQELSNYVEVNGSPSGPDVAALLARTADVAGRLAVMSVSEHQARYLEILTRAMGVELAVEVGTFTGRSSLAIAKGLPSGGRLICCDVSEEWTAVARDAWQAAGVDSQIELRIAPAIETLSALPSGEPIDLAFIDADKTGYLSYYELIVPKLRVGGVILVDNVLWSGRVIDESVDDPDTVALREFNAHVLRDHRTFSTLLPIGDGVSMHQRL